MNFGQLAVKALIVIVVLFFLSLAGAITFPALAVLTGTSGAGLASLLLFLLAMLLLAITGYLLGRGIRTVKKPVEALILTYAGAFLMGGVLTLYTLLNVPYTARVNLNWLGASWYSPWLTVLIIGSPIMLAFLVGE